MPITGTAFPDSRQQGSHKTYSLFSVNIDCFRSEELIALILDALAKGNGFRLAFANTNLINLARRDPDYSRILHEFVIVNDGIGVDIANYLINRKTFPENLNGTDFIPKLLQALPDGCRVAVVGSTEAVSEQACDRITQRYPQFEICYRRHGYFDDERVMADCMQEIIGHDPDVVLVGMGNPLQELFIDKLSDLNQKIINIGVGAYLDFASGYTPRAPLMLRKLRLEWLYRLVREPRRLARRYTVDIVAILFSAARARIAASRERG